jgi:hypothetical protein
MSWIKEENFPYFLTGKLIGPSKRGLYDLLKACGKLISNLWGCQVGHRKNLLLIVVDFVFWEWNCRREKVLYRECQVDCFAAHQFCRGSIF